MSGFFTRKQLETLRNFVDDDKYERSKEWRGEYQEMAKAMVNAVDGALQGQREPIDRSDEQVRAGPTAIDS